MDDKEIIVLVTADTNQLNSGMDAGAAKVENSMQKMQSSVRTASNQMLQDINLYNAGFGKSIKTMEQVGIAQDTLTRLTQSGILKDTEAAAAAATLAASKDRIAISAAKAAAALNKVSKEAQGASSTMQALAGNTRFMSEAATVLSEVATGQFGRVRRSIAAMANSSGVLRLAFTGVGAVVLTAAAAVAIYATACIQGIEEQEALTRSLLSTNGATGLSQDGFLSLANALATNASPLSTTRTLLEGLASTGQFTGQQLYYAGSAARSMAEATGVSMDDAQSAIAKMGQNPVRALAALNNQFDIVTEAQFRQVMALDEAGDHYGALTLALKLTSEGLEKIREKTEETKPPMTQMFELAERGFGSMWQGVKNFTSGSEMVDYWRRATLAISSFFGIEQKVVELSNRIHSALPMVPSLAGPDTKKPQGTSEADARESQQRKARINQAALEEKRNHDAQATQADRDRLNTELLTGNKSLEWQRVYWQSILSNDKAGVDEKRQATQELLQIRRSQNSEEAKLSHQQAAEARKAAREAAKESKQEARDTLAGLAVRREATQQFSQERAEIDQKMVDEAKKNYAKDHAAYFAMLRQQEADQKALAAEQLKLKRTKLEEDRNLAQQELAISDQQAEDDYQSGNISAQRLLQIHQQNVQKRLALDIAYYKAKKKLENGDVIEEAKDEAAILASQKKAFKQSEKLNTDYHRHIRQQWRQTARDIAHAMASSFAQMATSGGNFKDIMKGFGKDMLNTAIQYEEQKLEDWLTKLLTRKTADETTEAEQTATSVAMSAMRAGAAGTASFAGAPWPVDMGAPAFGASMAAAAASFSAAQGWERVPYDGAVTELHKDEMVLPKHVADDVRDGAGKGNKGGDHFHIHALDARSVKDMLRRHPAAIASSVKKAHRMGHFGGKG